MYLAPARIVNAANQFHLARLEAGFQLPHTLGTPENRPQEAQPASVAPPTRSAGRARPDAVVGRALSWARRNPELSIHSFLGRGWIWKVFGSDLERVPPPDHETGWRFRPVSAGELVQLAAGNDPFFLRQIERLDRFGRSHAFGVFVDGQIAHVSWMLATPADHLDSPRLLALAADEVEITACETLPAFRGRGIYPFAIRALAELARDGGLRRILMKTSHDNRASQTGMRKAGLEEIATVVVWNPPWNSARSMAVRFGPVTLAR